MALESGKSCRMVILFKQPLGVSDQQMLVMVQNSVSVAASILGLVQLSATDIVDDGGTAPSKPKLEL